VTTPLIQRPFPDIELVLIDLLDPALTAAVTATGAELKPPMVQIERVGGADDGITDRPRVRLRCIGGNRTLAWTLARQTQAFLATQALGRIITGPWTQAEYPSGVMLDAVSTATPPRQVPEAGRTANMVDVIMEIHLRRPWW
jgi:hypothetical protein